jgi:hypothetical protein
VRALPHGKTITIVRPGAPARDDYGNDVPGAPTNIQVPGCAVEPHNTATAGPIEVVDARDTVTSGLKLYAPTGTDLRATDQVIVDGVLYNVYGRSGDYQSPFTGSTGPVEASLEYVTG